MNRSQPPVHPPAFSLIEVLFAVLLLSVILFGVIRLQVSQLRLTEAQKNEIDAYALAHDKAEQVLALGEEYIGSACTGADLCRCVVEEGGADCSEDAVGESGLFSHYFWLDKTDVIDAWKVTSIVEWEDATGLHNAENGGGAQVRRILY